MSTSRNGSASNDQTLKLLQQLMGRMEKLEAKIDGRPVQQEEVKETTPKKQGKKQGGQKYKFTAAAHNDRLGLYFGVVEALEEKKDAEIIATLKAIWPRAGKGWRKTFRPHDDIVPGDEEGLTYYWLANAGQESQTALASATQKQAHELCVKLLEQYEGRIALFKNLVNGEITENEAVTVLASFPEYYQMSRAQVAARLAGDENWESAVGPTNSGARNVRTEKPKTEAPKETKTKEVKPKAISASWS